MSLFREQAINSKRSGGWMGEVSLATPLSLHLATLCVVLIGGALFAFIFLGQYTRRAQVSGTVMPIEGLIEVTAPSAGVAALLVRTGVSVRGGDMLMRVSGQPVHASADGTVYAVLVEQGQRVQAGQALLSLLRKDQRIRAELLVHQNAIGSVAPGTHVVLRYPALSPQRFGFHHATVRTVSRVPTATAGETAAMYRVYVDIAGHGVGRAGQAAEMLRAGMLIDADIFLERRSLAEWALAPVLDRDAHAVNR